MRKIYRAMLTVLLFTVLTVLPWTTVMAKENKKVDKGSVYAVQKKLYSLKHEFNLGGAVLPMDALYKGVALNGGYTYHFSHHWAWEVAQVVYSWDIDTGLKTQLQENLSEYVMYQWMCLPGEFQRRLKKVIYPLSKNVHRFSLSLGQLDRSIRCKSGRDKLQSLC